MNVADTLMAHPIEIQESLARFRADHPDPATVAFVMMRFDADAPFQRIVEAIRGGLAPFGITALRADDKEYHDDLFLNVLTYVYGCGVGVAVFERITSENTNPNIALELGYMFALRKPVCLLKDQTLPALQSDLVGKLYRPFDTFDPAATVPRALTSFLEQRGFPRSASRQAPFHVGEPMTRTVPEDFATWTADDYAQFFSSLERDAYLTAIREYENVPLRDFDGTTQSRARELVLRQVTAYGLRDLYEAWKRR